MLFQFLGNFTAVVLGHFSLFLYSFIDSVNLTIRCITGIVKKLAFFFAGWTPVRWCISFQRISAIPTFPTRHMITSFMLSTTHEYCSTHGPQSGLQSQRKLLRECRRD